MVWVNCPRNVQDHNCPNEELGDWLTDTPEFAWGNPDPSECSGACEGEINVAYEEIEEQTCSCVLTEKEWAKVWERGDDAFIGQMEDYYESRARLMVDGNDY